MKSPGVAVTFMCLLFAPVHSFAAEPASGNPVMPIDLIHDAEEKGCRQVSDFYQITRGYHPPFVYQIVMQGLNDPSLYWDHSAAYWCESGEGAEKIYSLILDLDERVSWPGDCALRIDTDFEPGGLRIYADEDDPLDWYETVEGRVPVPEGSGNIAGPIINSDWSGTGVNYYCHEGTWLQNVYD